MRKQMQRRTFLFVRVLWGESFPGLPGLTSLILYLNGLCLWPLPLMCQPRASVSLSNPFSAYYVTGLPQSTPSPPKVLWCCFIDILVLSSGRLRIVFLSETSTICQKMILHLKASSSHFARLPAWLWMAVQVCQLGRWLADHVEPKIISVCV